MKIHSGIMKISLSCLLLLQGTAALAKDVDEKESVEIKERAMEGTDTAAPCISWSNPLVKPRVVLLCIHGLGLYSGSYQNFGIRMARLGIQTYAIDVRGFGSWMKAEGHEQIDFIGCLNDVKTALTSIRAANPGLPVFLLGESMGGAIALRATALFPELVDGLISCVPASERYKQKKEDIKVAFEFLKGPNKQFDIGKQIVDQATEKNPTMRKDWQQDPMDRMDLSAKELMQFQKFMNENHDSVKSITKTPVLMIQGTEDKLVKPTGTWDLFNEIPSVEKEFLAVPSEHLVFEEQQDRARGFDARIDHSVATWILETAGEYSPAPRAARKPVLTQAISLMIAGNYAQAEANLHKFIQTNPTSGEAHYWLGIANMKTQKPLLARKEFVTAMSLGNASGHADEANRYLMTMSSSTPGSPASTSVSTLPPGGVAHTDITQGQPAVVAFYASWCEQCKNLDSILTQARTVYGPRVKLLKVDMDDANNKEMVKSFDVGPIPTFVYLTANGQVASTSIGRTNFISFAQRVSTILKK
jgi:alpha-beta hydrolase superfamily lysophospholipase/thiol-disulfide isomerase/thioredoxin